MHIPIYLYLKITLLPLFYKVYIEKINNNKIVYYHNYTQIEW